jgi:hypothetical protein
MSDAIVLLLVDGRSLDRLRASVNVETVADIGWNP